MASLASFPVTIGGSVASCAGTKVRAKKEVNVGFDFKWMLMLPLVSWDQLCCICSKGKVVIRIILDLL